MQDCVGLSVGLGLRLGARSDVDWGGVKYE